MLIGVDTQSLENANLLPAMMRDVTITTAERSNVLLVPVKEVEIDIEINLRSLREIRDRFVREML